jgi:sugar phosphate isomerase/epimerase
LPEGPFAIVEISTPSVSFEEDLAAYAAAGVRGIGIWEPKLDEGREGEQLAAFRASGLRASAAIPAVPSILPLPLMPGPATAEERVDAYIAAMRRLAPLEPTAFVCLTGPAGDLREEEARALVAEGLRALGDEAVRLGVPVGLEPMSAHYPEWTIVRTLGEADELITEAGGNGLGLTFDTWHLWDTAALEEDLARHGHQIVAVHVGDWREPTRSWCDRVLPGDGVIKFDRILGALEAAGWEGFYELEIFSDDGTFGDAFGDSLWRWPAVELAERGRRAFESHPSKARSAYASHFRRRWNSSAGTKGGSA